MKKYIQPSMAIAIIENIDNILLTTSATDSVGYSEGGDGLGYSKGLDNLDRGDISDNGLWSKDRW